MGYGLDIEHIGEVNLYRFGRSRQIFRGIRPDMRNPYIAFIGGSEPFGKYVRVPFPKRVQQKLHETCVNWGTPGAGPGFFLKDPVLLEACCNARVCVIQAMDPIALSNRMYSVFPRRNLRLRNVSGTLRLLFPTIHFDDYKYVPAMIRKLVATDPEAYKVVLVEQKSAWIARTMELLEAIETPKILLWITRETLDPSVGVLSKEMIDLVAHQVDRVVVCPIDAKSSGNPTFGAGARGSGWMSKNAHQQVADVVSAAIQEVLGTKEKHSKMRL